MSESDDQVPMNKPEGRRQHSIINNPSGFEEEDDAAGARPAGTNALAQHPQSEANVPSSSVSAAVVVANNNTNNETNNNGGANGSTNATKNNGNEKPNGIAVYSHSELNSSNNEMNMSNTNLRYAESKEDINDINSPSNNGFPVISPSGTLTAMSSFQMAVQSQDLNDQQLLARFAITLTYLLFSCFFG